MMRHGLNVNILQAEGAHNPATLLFAHGYGCDQTLWHGVAQALPQTRRVLFDWPGAGGSDVAAYDPIKHGELDGYADDLIALMEDLDLQDVIVVGHSVAATIGMLAARRAPLRFGMLAMVSPSPCFLNDLPSYEGGFDGAQLEALITGLAEGQAAWSRSFAPLVMGNADRPVLSTRLADSFCAMDPAIALRWARATFMADIRLHVPEVEVPCVVMQAQDDALAPVAVGHWLHSHLPSSQLVLLQASGHCPHVSAPAEVADVLRARLAWRG